jgi:Predicted pPIWI-associating nuclease
MSDRHSLIPALREALDKFSATQRAFRDNSALSAALTSSAMVRQTGQPSSALVAALRSSEATRRSIEGSPALREALDKFSATQRAFRDNSALSAALTSSAMVRQTVRTDAAPTVALRSRAPVRAPASLDQNQTRSSPAEWTSEALAARPAWHEAGVIIRRRTVTLIAHLDPGLEERLEGAWERVSRGGPHAASQAAHSMIEFVDWCLRTAAPDEAALGWHMQESRLACELHNGRPTRALRMRYMLRARNPDGPVAQTFVDHALATVRNLQEIKHTSKQDDLHALAAMIMALETVLAYLFGPSGRG